MREQGARYEISPRTNTGLPLTLQYAPSVEVAPGMNTFPSMLIPETPNIVYRRTKIIAEMVEGRYGDVEDALRKQVGREIQNYFRRLQQVRGERKSLGDAVRYFFSTLRFVR